MTNILEGFAQIDASGQTQVTACSKKPLIDGYTLTTVEGWPYHVHPEATPEQWRLLQDAIAAGEVSVTNWTAPKPQPADVVILGQIATLEASITPRRTREAVLGTDNGWLKGADDSITELRDKLAALKK